MSDRMRLTGMYSGMDTETIVKELVKAKETKVTKLKNDQKKLEWKQTAWQDLNAKIYGLYSNTLSNLRLSGAYKKKKTTSSDTTKATVVSSENAMDGTQTLKVNQVAKAGYLTGAKISQSDGSKITKTDKLINIDGTLPGQTISVTVGQGADAKTTDIEITEDMTVNSLLGKFAEAGVNANFDEDNQRFFISAKGTGMSKEFSINCEGNALASLGIDDYDYSVGAKMNAKNASGDEILCNNKTKLADIQGIVAGSKLVFSDGDKSETFEVTADTTIEDLLKAAEKGGLKASFDQKTQQFSFKSSDITKEVSVSAAASDDPTDTKNADALAALGLNTFTNEKINECTRIKAQDSEIVLNGAKFTSDSNTYSVNGLTINATGVTEGDEEIQIVTTTDYDGIYSTIKDFLTEYNELMKEMDKLYNADSARKYDMLEEDQKESMTDDEVDQWEGKIKGALLRKDDTLGRVMNSMINYMMGGFQTASLTDEQKKTMSTKEIADWEKQHTKYLSDYGIETLSYFEAADNERHLYHIAGDKDDEATTDKDDKLKKAITEDPEGTAQFFANLCKGLYDQLYSQMNSTEYSSIYKVYNDKQMKKDYDDYTSKISKAEKELNAYEDRWYDKFTQMEKAMAKMQSAQSSVTGMLG